MPCLENANFGSILRSHWIGPGELRKHSVEHMTLPTPSRLLPFCVMDCAPELIGEERILLC